MSLEGCFTLTTILLGFQGTGKKNFQETKQQNLLSRTRWGPFEYAEGGLGFS